MYTIFYYNTFYFKKVLETEETTKIITVQGVDGNKISAEDINGKEVCLIANGEMEEDLFEVAGDKIKVWVKDGEITKFEKI